MRSLAGDQEVHPADQQGHLPETGIDARERLLLLGAVTLGIFWAIGTTDYAQTQWWTAALLLVGVLAAGAVIRRIRFAEWGVLGYVVVVGITDRLTRVPFLNSDVMAATQEAITVLARGENPYAHVYLTVDSPPPSQFPYLPGEIAFYAIPNALFGQVMGTDRWAGIGVVLLLASLAFCVGAAQAAMATSLFATFGFAATLSLDGSNDTGLAFLVLLAVVLLAFSERRGARSRDLFYASALVFAWALLFKHFAWLVYPFVLVYLRRAGLPWRRHATISVGLAALVTLPFFITAPLAFIRNVGRSGAHENVWGLNLWALLKPVVPGLIDTITPGLFLINIAAVVATGVILLRRPAPNLGLALFQGAILVFVALFMANWTTSSYYIFLAAVVAASLSLVPSPFPSPVSAAPKSDSRRIIRFEQHLPARPATSSIPAALVLIVALGASLTAWTSGWLTSAGSAGEMFRVTTPSVITAEEMLSVATTVTSDSQSELRAWYFLSKPGELEPWTNYLYQSSSVEHSIPANEPVTFHWSESLEVPDGTYQLSVWLHRQVGGDWVHADGGAFDLPPLTIHRGRVEASGPYRLATTAEWPMFHIGTATPLDLEVTGTGSVVECQVRWRLLADNGFRQVATGQGGPCTSAKIDLDVPVSPGPYTLEVIALAKGSPGPTGDDSRQSVGEESLVESDRLTIPVSVE